MLFSVAFRSLYPSSFLGDSQYFLDKLALLFLIASRHHFPCFHCNIFPLKAASSFATQVSISSNKFLPFHRGSRACLVRVHSSRLRFIRHMSLRYQFSSSSFAYILAIFRSLKVLSHVSSFHLIISRPFLLAFTMQVHSPRHHFSRNPFSSPRR